MPAPARSGRLLRLLAFLLVLAAGLWLRGRDLDAKPTSGDESESAINALTIAQHGLPRGEYLGLPIYENCLIEPWPDHPEYEFRDSSYTASGLTIYHGWLPLYAMWASQRAMGVRPDEVLGPGEPLAVRHAPQEVRRRVVAARAPSVLFGGLFLVFLFLAGREMFGNDAAFAAMAVGAVGRPLVYFAREARYYSATLALSTGCCWVAWRVYRRGRWGDFLLAAVLLALLFHTHLLAFFVAAAMTAALTAALTAAMTAALLWRATGRGAAGDGSATPRRWPDARPYLPRIAAAVVIVAAAAVPWLAMSGFLAQSSHLPAAWRFLSFPADLIWYPALRVPYLLLPIACAAWLGVVALLHHRLPPRLTRPLASHRRRSPSCWRGSRSASSPSRCSFPPPATFTSGSRWQ
jgi:hypothetical protein